LKTKQERPQRRSLGGESAVEGDRISPLESHRQPLEQVCCFPGVFTEFPWCLQSLFAFLYFEFLERDGNRDPWPVILIGLDWIVPAPACQAVSVTLRSY